jgi:hypothetical protein
MSSMYHKVTGGLQSNSQKVSVQNAVERAGSLDTISQP